MYITNTTFVVRPHADGKWLEVMRGSFIPMLSQGGFRVLELCRLLLADAQDHFTYSLQVQIDDMEGYRRFTDEMLGEWARIAGPLFDDGVLWFNTIMKRIEY